MSILRNSVAATIITILVLFAFSYFLGEVAATPAA